MRQRMAIQYILKLRWKFRKSVKSQSLKILWLLFIYNLSMASSLVMVSFSSLVLGSDQVNAWPHLLHKAIPLINATPWNKHIQITTEYYGASQQIGRHVLEKYLRVYTTTTRAERGGAIWERNKVLKPNLSDTHSLIRLHLLIILKSFHQLCNCGQVFKHMTLYESLSFKSMYWFRLNIVLWTLDHSASLDWIVRLRILLIKKIHFVYLYREIQDTIFKRVLLLIKIWKLLS